MQLPYSDKLNIGHLSRLFANTTNCYKFFWFLAILKSVDGHSNRFSFEALINEMIVEAWYMFHFHRVISGTVYPTASDSPFSFASRSAFSRSYLRRI